MDQNSGFPPGGTPDRPSGDLQPGEQQPAVPPQPPQPQDQQYTPPTTPPSAGYVAPPADYTPPPPGYTQPQPTPPIYPQQGTPPPYPQQPYQQPPGAPPPAQGYGGPPPPGYPPQQGYPQGYQQGMQPPPGYPPPNYGVPPKKSGMPVWGWIAIGLVTVVIVGCVAMFALLGFIGSRVSTITARTFSEISSGLGTTLNEGTLLPMGTVLGFYGNLESGDFDGAHSMLSSEMASRYSADNLRTRWTALTSKVGTVSAGLPGNDSVNGNSASITQELTSTNGQTYTIKVKLTRAGANDLLWQISGADPDLIPSP